MPDRASDLRLDAATPQSVRIRWTNNSAFADAFVISRTKKYAPLFSATVGSDLTSFEDQDLYPLDEEAGYTVYATKDDQGSGPSEPLQIRYPYRSITGEFVTLNQDWTFMVIRQHLEFKLVRTADGAVLGNVTREGPHEFGYTPVVAAFSRDGLTLATGDSDGWILLVGITDAGAQLLRAVRAGSDPVRCLSFSSDGAWLAADGPGGIELWNTATGTVMRRFQAPAESGLDLSHCVSLVTTPDDRLLIGSTGRHVYAFDVETGEFRFSHQYIPDGQGIVEHGLSINREGSRFLTVHREGVGVWRTSDGTRERLLRFSGEPSAASFTSDGTGVVISSYWGSEVINVDTGARIRDLHQYRFVQFSTGGRYALTRRNGETYLRLWDLTLPWQLAN